MIKVTVDPTTYLDRRQPEWLEHERAGLVKYDSLQRIVHVDDSLGPVIEALREKK